MNGQLTDEQFYAQVDTIQAQGAANFVANMGLDTTGWNIAG